MIPSDGSPEKAGPPLAAAPSLEVERAGALNTTVVVLNDVVGYMERTGWYFAAIDVVRALAARLPALEASELDAKRWQYVRQFLRETGSLSYHDRVEETVGFGTIPGKLITSREEWLARGRDAPFDVATHAEKIIDAQISAARSLGEDTING